MELLSNRSKSFPRIAGKELKLYAGEVIPVDTLSTNLAEQVGFVPHKIYVLPQRKGNSSQQMGKFGREALRKSITVWKKPA